MDVNSAFLYGVLKEEVYMELPEGYRQPGKVARLLKCIYGLKQSAREWYECLAHSLHTNGFTTANFDPCVFIHTTEKVFVSVYVDDIMIFGAQSSFLDSVRTSLKSDFECKDLGDAKYILGLEIIRTQQGLLLSQHSYIEKILAKYKMSDCRPLSAPIDPNTVIRTGDPEEVIDNITEYQSLVGSITYAVIGTRLDLAHTIALLSQYSAFPTEDHMKTAKRVLRYLKRTSNWCLLYPKQSGSDTFGSNSFGVVTHTDSSYASCPDTRKSFSGYVVRLGNATISWRSKKQACVATSTTEAEYMAMSLAARQLMWIKGAIIELGYNLDYHLFGDNNGALELTKNPRISDRSKHIDVHYHYTREKLQNNEFFLHYIPTADNLADILTKALPATTHNDLSKRLGCVERGEVLKGKSPTNPRHTTTAD